MQYSRCIQLVSVLSLAFIAACEDATRAGAPGSLQITAITTGSDPDPDGYFVVVDDGAPVVLASNGSVTVTGLRVGNRTVRLSGVASNCSAGPRGTRGAEVADGQLTVVTFEISCTARVGTIVVSTNTTGTDFPVRGHSVGIDDGTAAAVIVNGMSSWYGIREGQHAVWLRDLAPNCTLVGSNPRMVTVAFGQTTDVGFNVTCTVNRLAPGARLAFVRDGRIYTVNSDGTDEVRLTDGPNDSSPAWSPDGRRIAFLRGSGRVEPGREALDMYVIDADGSNLVRRTHTGFNEDPSWSPDSKRIAFTCSPGMGSAEVCIVSASEDGSGPTVLTSRPGYDAQPAWSPDGLKIAFVSDYRAYDTVYDVYVMNADGANVRMLMEGPFFGDGPTYYFQPAWSPIGHKLAVTVCMNTFSFCDPTAIAVLDFDGYSGLTTLTGARGFAKPAWSPDGRTIAFSSAGTVRWVTSDGSDQGTIVINGHSPSWRP